jgi:hypothetical protein
MMRTIYAAALIWAAPAAPTFSQDFPTSALTSYSDFRAAMLKYGWQPDQTYGDPIYGFPEVLCGAHMCSARWKAKNGDGLTITLWQDDASDLKVAPQTESD